MIEVTLTYPTPEGSREIKIDTDKTTFGRSDEADYRFDDQGLSRLNSVLYRDGDRVWIVDQNSTNGTFVNGSPAAGAGTPLRSGDVVKIGNSTRLTVRMADRSAPPPRPQAVSSTAPAATASAPAGPPTAASILPIALIALAVVVISLSGLFIGFTVFGVGKTEVVQLPPQDPDRDPDSPPSKNVSASSTPANDNASGTTLPADNSNINTGPVTTSTPTVNVPSGKKYLEMSDTEKRQYLEAKAMRIAQLIGNNSTDPIPANALDKIKGFTEGYASRLKSPPPTGCKMSGSLQTTYERASKNAPFIIRAFNEKGVPSQVGLYLAMIESEHCVCLQSGTGPLGMFQFTYATAKLHFEPSDGVVKGASPTSPDVRCKPEPASHAAASYMKALTQRFGTGALSVPLAIGSYNSGEGGLNSNLQKALEANTGQSRDFWSLIANSEKLSKQFQMENFKYVPKFFAAAIIGENPQDFGMTLQPLSSYTK